VEAARIVEAEAAPDVIDLNFGCPVKKVAGKGAGAGLLREPDKMLAITRAVVNAVHLPVTVKTRLGWDETSLYLPDGTPFIVDMAERLQDCGISELAIHGRTRSQMYRGEADWTLIGEVKNNPRIHIPIIGNGDITTPERARECFDKYGVDAIMIGRASFGCPWIFAEIKEALTAPAVLQAQPVLQQRGPTAEFIPRSMATKVAILKEHVDASIAWIGDERKGIVHSRRHFAASPVFKGLFDFKQTRIALLRADTRAEVFSIMDEIVDRYSH
jgi:nifR3 family TIM-barrel protein